MAAIVWGKAQGNWKLEIRRRTAKIRPKKIDSIKTLESRHPGREFPDVKIPFLSPFTFRLSLRRYHTSGVCPLS
jgi:hypothetical protein